MHKNLNYISLFFLWIPALCGMQSDERPKRAAAEIGKNVAAIGILAGLGSYAAYKTYNWFRSPDISPKPKDNEAELRRAVDYFLATHKMGAWIIYWCYKRKKMTENGQPRLDTCRPFYCSPDDLSFSTLCKISRRIYWYEVYNHLKKSWDEADQKYRSLQPLLQVFLEDQ